MCSSLIGMVPLSAKLSEFIMNSFIKEKMSCQGQLVWPLLTKQRRQENEQSLGKWFQPTVTAVVVVSTALIILLVVYIRKKFIFYRHLSRDEWSINIEDILFYNNSQSPHNGKSSVVMWPSVTSLTAIDELEDGQQV